MRYGTLVVILAGLAGCSPGGGGGANTSVPGNEAAGLISESIAEPPAKSILRPEVAPPEPEVPALEPLHLVIGFGDTGSRLDEAATQALDTIITDPVMQAGGAITLRGHSDTRGSDGDNLLMSRKRAEAVRDYLAGKGVNADRITVIAMGEAAPLVPNLHPDGSDDPDARARNRRVEMEVALPAAAPAAEDADDAPGNAASAQE